MSENIYFDNAATTPLIPEVKEAICDKLNEFGNPSSLHTLGFNAEKSMSETRTALLKNLGAQSVIFTSSGSEANNLALLSGAEKNARAGNRIITTNSEHPSVTECCHVLEKRGFDVVYLSTRNGKIDMAELEDALSVPVCLVSIMHTNNETGAVYPVSEISKIVRRKYPRALIHSDCVQAFLKSRFTLSSLGVDMVSISAHKVHALKGVGALVLAKPLALSPVIYGGGQEKGIRSGTENTVGIASLGMAIKTLSSDTERLDNLQRLSDRLVTQLSCVDGVQLNLPEQKSPTVINFSVPGIRSETLLHSLSSRGIFVSSGSACSSKAKTSPVLEAFGLDKPALESAVRISFSGLNTEEESDIFISVLNEEITRLKGKK